jgi:hypothetical protein
VLRKIVIAVVLVLAAAWGIHAWFKKHQQEAQRDAAYKAHIALETEQAKSALARLRASWNADTSWEHQVYPPNNDAPSYSLDIEHALVNGHPIIVIGEIQDVKTIQGQSAPVVLIQSHSSANLVDLRFSLVTTPEIATSILAATRNDPLAQGETFISVATVERVEKIEQPPDSAGNDQSYFLAHGTLQEAYGTHLLAAEPKELGEN